MSAVKCGAALWLQNRITAEWYQWVSCTANPGHSGPHSDEAYDEANGGECTAVWTDERNVSSWGGYLRGYVGGFRCTEGET